MPPLDVDTVTAALIARCQTIADAEDVSTADVLARVNAALHPETRSRSVQPSQSPSPPGLGHPERDHRPPAECH
jgi:hypothetical protein